MLLSKHPRSAFDNHILAALPRTEYERLYPYLELVRLPQHKILYMTGDIVRYGYLLLGEMASLISITESGKAIEVGMIGNEGMASICQRAEDAPINSSHLSVCGGCGSTFNPGGIRI
jgi:hypothetical protein